MKIYIDIFGYIWIYLDLSGIVWMWVDINGYFGIDPDILDIIWILYVIFGSGNPLAVELYDVRHQNILSVDQARKHLFSILRVNNILSDSLKPVSQDDDRNSATLNYSDTTANTPSFSNDTQVVCFDRYFGVRTTQNGSSG
ncbi:hypothetical protein FQR65_LT13250 [Abscondita terminalis]|nr:hypothetical protein FQR65_LT13250 [Abscondita terminalis]